jgi:hypothetical protein
MNPDQLSSSAITPQGDQIAIPTDYNSITAAVVSMTKSLFGDDIKVVEQWDPEIKGWWYIALYVTSTLSDEEIASREDKWEELLREKAMGAHGHYCIIVDAR